MIEVAIPQDIRKYEPTLIGPFTGRQCMFGAIGIAFAIGGYFLEKAVGISEPLNFPIFICLAAPPIMIGWYKPYGINFERFISIVWQDNFQCPQHRVYAVSNMWTEMIKEDEAAEAAQGKKKPAKKKKPKTPRSQLPEEMRAYK